MSFYADVRRSSSPGLATDENFSETAARLAGYVAAFTNASLVDVVHTLGYHPNSIEVYVSNVKVGAKVVRLNDSHFQVRLSGTHTGEVRFN